MKTVLNNLKSFKSLVPAVFLSAMIVAGATVAAAPRNAIYLGMRKCKPCHYKHYRRWKKMKHAQAFENLEEKDRTNPECVRCHVTAFGMPSGYIDEEKTPHLTGVQCEACHGPGSAHAEAIDKDLPIEDVKELIDLVPQNTCAKCHNPHKTCEERAEEEGNEE